MLDAQVSPMDRRMFMAATAGLAAGAMARPLWARTLDGWQPSTLRVGLVGCGGRGTGAAMQAIMADPGAVLWAAGDAFEDKIAPSIDRLQAICQERHEDQQDAGTTGGPDWLEKVNVPDERRFVGFDAYKKVIDECDVVLLTTPPGFRPQHLAYAVDKGRHVFCEKPVAVDSAGVRSVLDSARKAKENNLSLMSGFCWRYNLPVRETFKAIQDGALGDVHTTWCTYNTNGWITPRPRQAGWSDAEFQLRNWWYFTPISGDHIVEQAIHAIDWIAYAKGDTPPVRCIASGGRTVRPDKPETGNVWDNFSVMYEYADGSRGYHMCRHWPDSAGDNSAYIVGSKGRCTMTPWTPQNITIQRPGASDWKPTAPRNDMYQQEHDELFAAIRDGKPVNDGLPMTHSTLLGIMGREAAYTGKQVTWDNAMAMDQDLNAEDWRWGERATHPVPKPGTARLG